ncbi:MAG: NADPH-dependent glutamate synthase [Chitinivibrionia bacterium]|nr:NADPH-dependent glutamate synthase [Chitinivibrionia bacterium]
MVKILKKQKLSDTIFRLRLEAEKIAKKRKAGQFVIIRISADGERIPLTIADANDKEGWIEIIVQAVGKSTKKLMEFNENDYINDLAGPLGNPTHIEKFGKVLCIGGGLGAAPLYPIANAMKDAGNEVTAIIGARNKDLLILEDDFRKFCDNVFITTDDGTAGIKGFAADVIKKLIAEGKKFDCAVVVGPPIMMKFTSKLTVENGIKTFVSLNPIMIDGTGMCGGCRVSINGETKFACVDGPEFDASLVNWDELLNRLGSYEKIAQKNESHTCNLYSAKTENEVEEPTKTSNRTQMRCRDANERRRNFEEVNLGFSQVEATKEAARCLECKKPRCVDGCPVGINIPDFIRLVKRGDFIDALAVIKKTNALPAVCGRVCPQETQCEAKCILGIKSDSVAIGALERFVADWNCEHHTPNYPVYPKSGKKVAIIGSGPAGLSTAGYLAKHGVEVVVFEALHEVGGVLVYGIPEFRLPKSVVQMEVDELKEIGVKFETNFVVGKTATIDDLLEKEGFSAAFIGSGAGLPKFPNIKGINANGVYSANEYLTRVNLMHAWKENSNTPIIKGKKAVVMGGGNVAMDAVRVALRLGANEAHIVYRRSFDEMPARKEEILHAQEEGVIFDILRDPKEVIVGEDGFVCGVKCIKCELGEPDNSGRRSPVEIPNSEFVIECDVFIVAIGTSPNPIIAQTTQNLDTSKYGTITATSGAGRTSRPNVYAGGDIVTGAATVIMAMGAGKEAAKAILTDIGLE